MIHNLRKRGVQDASKINVHEYPEVQEWASKFQVSTKILFEAIAAVGPGVSKVREYLHAKGFIVAT